MLVLAGMIWCGAGALTVGFQLMGYIDTGQPIPVTHLVLLGILTTGFFIGGAIQQRE